MTITQKMVEQVKGGQVVCTNVIPFLSSGFARNNQIVPMFVLFSQLFCHCQRLAFFSKMEGQTLHHSSETRYFWLIFQKHNKRNNFFKKKPGNFD